MREILFRGKSIDDGKWVEGYLLMIPSPIQWGDSSPWFIDVPPQDPDGIYSRFNVDEKTVGQYTGLTDKNGKRIFEGDIVKYGDITGIINYSFGCYCVKTNKPDWRGRNNPAIDIVFNEYPNEVKVIGNIHDNPELLKGE